MPAPFPDWNHNILAEFFSSNCRFGAIFPFIDVQNRQGPENGEIAFQSIFDVISMESSLI
jgi:hypothetical protein